MIAVCVKENESVRLEIDIEVEVIRLVCNWWSYY
jgi:hypothetical protein